MMYIGDQKYVPLINNNKVTPTSPDHYDAEIEYLESNGTQWIDTKIECSSSVQLITKGKFTQNIADENFGMINTNGIQRFHFGIYMDKFIFGVGSTYNDNTLFDLEVHTFTLDGSGYGKLDDTKYTLRKFDNTRKLKIYLFARNTNNQATTQAYFQLFSQQILINNVLVFNAIPVRVGQIGYLYDKVSGRLFGNKGTGEFILGPDKT